MLPHFSLLCLPGSVYKKAIYYEYEDIDFKKRIDKLPQLGVLGPVIGGEVGDTIKVKCLLLTHGFLETGLRSRRIPTRTLAFSEALTPLRLLLFWKFPTLTPALTLATLEIPNPTPTST